MPYKVIDGQKFVSSKANPEIFHPCGMFYEIMISEAQRARIEKALKLLDVHDPLPIIIPPDGELEDHKCEYLTEMFEDLPKDEEASPGVTHGFCL
jgi:hypothetical protein